MSSSYGISPWGLGSWGSSGVFRGVFAVACTTHTVRVGLSARTRAISPTGPGDALNPETWYVVSSDLLVTLTVLAVVQINRTTFELYTMQDLGNVNDLWRVGSDTLLSAGGSRLEPPAYLTFRGVHPADAALRPVLRARDLANTQVSPGEAGGTLRMTPGGDYATHSGAELLKKLIWRRITTTPGSFFHLGESYGTELKLKSLVRDNDLLAMQAKLAQQIREEPDVQDVHVELSLASSGILKLRVRVQSVRLGSGTAEFTARS